ncbi:unnamed protein product [Sphagnum troendelagicum]|uniref:Odorant receptor n=1 Tax=Sphagnum troendelagicum TaxID=128251 RepID=A0ABP0V011_9BRYO
MSPPLLKQTVVQSSDAELESLDSSLMERTQLNVSNFNLAIYIGLVHAGLVLCILIFYSVSQLLKDYWKPIRWAILLSMPLRKVQGEVVHFWETPLQNGFLETVIAIPQATTHAVKESVADACDALLEMCGRQAPFPRHIGFVKLSQWLLTFTLFILGYEFLGPTYMGAIIVLMFSSQAALGQIMPVFGVAIELSPTAAPQVERRSSLAQLYEFTVQPLVRMTRWTNRGVTQSLIESLPAAVAVVLIIVMCILLTGGILLFTYKVGMESKDAVMAFKSHMQSCGGAAPGTLSRWVEDNKIPQYIDSHSNKAYNILVHKVDEIAAKNNMTELKDVYSAGKQFLVSSSKIMTGGMYFIVVLGLGVFNFISQALMFFSLLYFLITSKAGGVMYQVLDMVPVSDQTRQRCATVLDHAVSSVLLTTTKTMFYQASLTYLLFRFFQIHFLYMSTLIALVQGLIPLFPKGIALLPAVAQLALQRHYLGAATIVGTYVYFMNYGVLKIQGTISKHNKYLTGLSIAGGLTLFSPSMEGVFLGPLIMTVLYAAKILYTEFVLDVHAEYTA